MSNSMIAALKKCAKWLFKGLACLLLAFTVLALLYALWVNTVYRDLTARELTDRHYSEPVQELNIDGVNLRYQEQGTGPALLLLHSNYLSMTMWNDWMEPLSKDFRVIRFDMTSHGLTGPDPSGDYSMDRSIQIIEALLAHLNVEKLSMVGSSLGGNMAFTYAAKHPDQIEHVVLINSGGLRRENARSGEIPDWINIVFYLFPELAYRRFLEWLIVDQQLVTEQLVDEFHGMMRREGNRVAILDRLRSFDIGEPELTLAKVKAPVMIMWGEENPHLKKELTAGFKEQLTNAVMVDVRIYPDIGHILPIEMPEQGVAEVKGFIASTAAQPDNVGERGK